jgi:hypothetical protein
MLYFFEKSHPLVLSNTRVLNALTQIQQAVQVLQQEAPQLLQNAP